jgi:hypothetical protein
MHARVIQALCLLLLLPLSAGAAPSEVESRLSLLAPVRVSEEDGARGRGLKLTFEVRGPNPALALLTLADAREVVAALEGEFKEARSRPGPHLVAGVPAGVVTAGVLGWASMIRRTSST